MEEIYPICLALRDSRPAALQFTSICWIKSLQRTVMACRCWAAGVYQRTSHKSLTINVIWGNLPPSKTMKKYLKTASLLNQNWASGFNSAVVWKSRPTSSSRYSSATIGTRLSQVRLFFSAGWRIQKTVGLQVLRSRLFIGTTRHPSTVKKSVTQSRNQRNAHARQIVTVLSRDGEFAKKKKKKSAATSCPCSSQWGHVEKLGVLMGKWGNIKGLACTTGIQVILKGGRCIVSRPQYGVN